MNDDDLKAEMDAQHKAAVRRLMRALDAYFACRNSLPKDSVSGVPYQREDKSTMDIIDDLKDMMAIDPEDVNIYMEEHHYSYVTTEDGKIKWAIWRNFNYPA